MLVSDTLWKFAVSKVLKLGCPVHLQFETSITPPLSASAKATRWKTLINGTCQRLRTSSGTESLSSSEAVMFRTACKWSLQLSGAASRVVAMSPTVEMRTSVAFASIGTRSSKERHCSCLREQLKARKVGLVEVKEREGR